VAAVQVSVSPTDARCLRTLAEAVSTTPPGGVVVVRPGVYREHLVLAADVTLVAQQGPGTVTVECDGGAAVFVSGGTVRLDGLRLAGVPGSPGTFPLVQVAGGALHLDGCELAATGSAALHVRGGRVAVRGGRVSNPGGAGLVFDRGPGSTVTGLTVVDVASAAVVLGGDADPVLEACVLRPGGRVAVVASDDARGRLERCHLGDTRLAGLLVQGRARPDVRDCVIAGGQDGVRVTEEAQPALTRCVVTGAAGHGVHADGRSRPRLSDCTVEATGGHGVLHSGSADGSADGCRVTGTASAGVVVAGAARLTFTDLAVDACATAGLLVDGAGWAQGEGLEVAGCPTGVLGATASAVVLRAVAVRHGDVGLRVAAGAARFDGVTLHDLATAGAVVDAGADLHLADGVVERAGTGVVVGERATADLTSLDVRAGVHAGVAAGRESTLVMAACRVQGNGDVGVSLAGGSQARLTDCDLLDNGRAGLLVRTRRPVRVTGGSRRGNGGPPVERAVAGTSVTVEGPPGADLP